MSKKHLVVQPKMAESRIKIPKKCNQKKCFMFTNVLFSKCGYNTDLFQECRESGYQKHFEKT